MPPSKWDLKFCGDKTGISLNAFLKRVEELRVARHVTKDKLLDSGIYLFEGTAYTFSGPCVVRLLVELVKLFKD